MSKPERYVVTGGPGSGKSTLIDALSAAGYATRTEAGRSVIREQVASGGTALPWIDPPSYARLMLERDLVAWHAERGPVFFDRGIPDIQGYLRLVGAEPLAEVEAAVAAHPYAATVFVAPPWREIYARDAERRQDFAEACRTFDAMCDTYSALAYGLLNLPLAPVAERLAFVRDALGWVYITT